MLTGSGIPAVVGLGCRIWTWVETVAVYYRGPRKSTTAGAATREQAERLREAFRRMDGVDASAPRPGVHTLSGIQAGRLAVRASNGTRYRRSPSMRMTSLSQGECLEPGR